MSGSPGLREALYPFFKHSSFQTHPNFGLISMASNQMPLVHGEILIPGEIDSFAGATAHIFLEDVSLIDTSAQPISHQTIPNISHEAGEEKRVEFTLRARGITASAMYSIRVHITFYDDDQIHSGDYISTENCPVLTQGHPNHVLVKVKKVT
jgi:uncharacterized lipoprotein YbaY